VRFALGQIQLGGKSGTIAATDGRQLLVYNGFQFPWEEDLLIPASKVFGSAELQGQSLAIGKTDDWLVNRLADSQQAAGGVRAGRYLRPVPNVRRLSVFDRVLSVLGPTSTTPRCLAAPAQYNHDWLWLPPGLC
jgi:hypothetical protein